MDVNETLVGPEERELLARDVVEPRSGRDHHVRRRPRLPLERRPPDTEVAEVRGVVVRKGVLTAPRGHDPGAARLREPDQRGGGVLEGHHLARDDERVARAGDQTRRLPHPIRRRHGAETRRRQRNRRIPRAGLGDVLGQDHHDRPGPTGQRQPDRSRRALGHVRPGLRLEHRLGDGRVHPVVVDLLERLLPLGVRRHVADQEEDGRRVLHGGVDPDRGVGRPRPAGHERGGGPPRELPVRLGRKGGARLVAGDDETEARPLAP